MCPFFEYLDSNSHYTKRLRSFARKYEPLPCPTCGENMKAVEISASHVEPDGLYSYAENLGNADQFERRLEAQKKGLRVYRKED